MAEELNNLLFEDEREFLERKKQEYERALRGDVDHIKDQSVQVGKVALVGAGLAGSIWLISKALGGKGKAKNKAKDKKKKTAFGSANHDQEQGRHSHADAYDDFDGDDDFDLDDEAFSLDRSAELRDFDDRADFGHEYDADDHRPGAYSARESARTFQAHDDELHADMYDHNDDLDRDDQPGDEDEDQSYGNGFDHAAPHTDQPVGATSADLPDGRLDFGPTVHLHKQGVVTEPVRAYDDSRRLPRSAEFTAEQPITSRAAKNKETASHHDVNVPWPAAQQGPSLGKRATEMAMSFLGTNTGKAVAAQATAVVLAYVSKKINDRMPVKTTDKNADLANAPATAPSYAVTPPTADSSPAVSLTYTDAPTEHPTS